MYAHGHVLVTGALGGLGTAIVARLLAEGARVVAVDRRNDDAGDWQAQFADTPGTLEVRTADLTRESEVEALARALEADGVAIAYLVNNAGVAGAGDPARMAAKTFDIVMKVNLYGTFHCTRAFVEGMRARGFGRIVNFASLYAYEPGPGQAPYAAAKAGIVGYTHSIARDLAAAGVTANVIAPGLIWHSRLEGVLPEKEYADMVARTPMQRAGTPAEIAGVVRFLLSDDAAYVTGQTLHVNGGVYLTG